ncbi:MAG: DUF4767 domain-containing protein [Leuconostoc pseudomesenteroides]|uniref:DUF4767 domain-containing protein n=1 Tax=Leuconostoc pseudomesenteroides TaxID=33968 RepID=UPI001E2A1AB2|nr:DUF4767 domain-containing protein [Leuconostoc pseudomesenteroides]MCC7668825.1 DUF4767 domain-containing protein [Leuconostoc pseudomesenteroides]
MRGKHMPRSTKWPVFVLIIIAVILAMIIYGASSRNQAIKNQKTVSHQSNLSSTRSSSIKSSSSNSSNQSTSSSDAAVKSTWNATKNKQLSDFMSQWQTEMNQTYTGTYDNQKPDYYGISFPTALENGRLSGHIKFDNQDTTIEWSPNGSSNSKNQVLAVAVGQTSSDGYNKILYLFISQESQPKVYVSQTTNGEDLYFTETKNTALENGFSQIYTGN